MKQICGFSETHHNREVFNEVIWKNLWHLFQLEHISETMYRGFKKVIVSISLNILAFNSIFHTIANKTHHCRLCWLNCFILYYLTLVSILVRLLYKVEPGGGCACILQQLLLSYFGGEEPVPSWALAWGSFHPGRYSLHSPSTREVTKVHHNNCHIPDRNKIREAFDEIMRWNSKNLQIYLIEFTL